MLTSKHSSNSMQKNSWQIRSFMYNWMVCPYPSKLPILNRSIQNTRWIILAILLMLAIVGVTWLVYQLSRRQATKRQKQTSQTSRGRRDAVIAKRASVDRLSSNDALPSQNDQQEALLQELLRLDKAYEAGTIKKAEYEEQRARIKTELRSLMSKDLVEQSATVKKTARSSGKGAT